MYNLETNIHTTTTIANYIVDENEKKNCSSVELLNYVSI